MTRVRLSSVATALVVVGLAVASSRAQDPPPGRPAPNPGPPAAPAASFEPERGPVRGFFQRMLGGGKKTPRSAHSDWTTGGDAKLSKPWLR